MRCSKCGYITFDNLDSCPKCAVGFTETAAQFQGAVFRAEAPFFLGSVVSSGAALAGVGQAALDMDLSMSQEELQQLDTSLEDNMPLEADDMGDLDMAGLADLPDEPEAVKGEAAAPAASEAEDEVFDLSDLMEDDDL
ncbi:MAG: hypothetical protein COZ12_09890 [Deltaproteobacteria bacterium CG_4_10_14_3_um_filter_60_8]|nr:MAG: hypothetical protein AUK28_08305 [Desulfobacterales bacterium CG2_30_60_27]PIY20153.1 MAG: hypothetical protein COZ12_09890 [Deltaproteobacteria bacterium CG_4_10_14_3_um_filter_60_8]